MTTVGAEYSMSLDGYIAGPSDDVSRVFAWMFAGDTDLKMSAGDHDFDLKVSEDTVKHFEELMQTTGAIVSGRRVFDVADAWGGKHPIGVHVFVVTHSIPAEWADSPGFTFVTDGVESAIRQAQTYANGKNVGVGGADITQQCLRAGLLDEIRINLVPVVLGGGVRLFDSFGPAELEIVGVREGKGVTHLTYRVIK